MHRGAHLVQRPREESHVPKQTYRYGCLWKHLCFQISLLERRMQTCSQGWPVLKLVTMKYQSVFVGEVSIQIPRSFNYTENLKASDHLEELGIDEAYVKMDLIETG